MSMNRVGLIALWFVCGCAGDPPASRDVETPVGTSDVMTINVTTAHADAVAIAEEKVVLAPKQSCVFSGTVQWDATAGELLVFEIQRRLPDGEVTTLANGIPKVVARHDGFVDFTVKTSIGDIRNVDCEAVIMSTNPAGDQTSVLASFPIRIGSKPVDGAN